MGKTPKGGGGDGSSKIKGKIHHCRLMKVGPPDKWGNPNGQFTEVWDTVGKPFENQIYEERVYVENSMNGRIVKRRRKLPKGEVVFETQSLDFQIARDRVDAYKKQHGIVGCGHAGFPRGSA